MGVAPYGKIRIFFFNSNTKYAVKFVRAQGSEWQTTPSVDQEWHRRDGINQIAETKKIRMWDDDIWNWLCFSIPGYPYNSIWALYFRVSSSLIRGTMIGAVLPDDVLPNGTDIKVGWVPNWEDRSEDLPIAVNFWPGSIELTTSESSEPDLDSLIPDDSMRILNIYLTLKDSEDPMCFGSQDQSWILQKAAEMASGVFGVKPIQQ